MRTNEKGITLVTLAITIIVMMILASTLLIMNQADPTSLQLAKDKKQETELLMVKEEIKMYLTENPPKSNDELVNIIENYGVVNNGDDEENATITTTKGNYTIKVKDIWNINALSKITGYETKNTDTTDKKGNRVVVPAGFKVVNPNDTVEDGIIIEDINGNNSDTVGNQFVWIPCTIDGANNTLKYDRYAFTRESPTWDYRQSLVLGTNGEYEKDSDGSYKIQKANDTSYYYHEAMSEQERASVEKYGGYYIGRYEVGCDTERSTSSKGNITDVARIKSGIPVYNYVTRDEAVTIAERMYAGKSRLCSSYAWDTALKFIDGESGTYAVNSIGDNNKTTSSSSQLENTGYHEEKNIYDMGGNVREWTTEIFTYASYPYVDRRWQLRSYSS